MTSFTPEEARAAGYRPAAKPERVASCRNCVKFACDHDDREGSKGVTFRRVNLRCKLWSIRTTLNSVCDSHGFRYPDRRDV